jgi:murein DD-endopeptidase MepM/ murein hydrolase activator NlpD
VCWDTDPDVGEETPDRPFNTVEVRISGPTKKDPKATAGSGVATFNALGPGSYSISAMKLGFEDVSADVPDPLPPGVTRTMLNGPHKVAIHTTTKAVRVLRRQQGWGRDKRIECTRKHALHPPGSPGTRTIPISVFWIPWDEPSVMVVRDFLWLTALVTSPVALGAGNLALAAWAFAFFSYLSTVIFGQVAGIVLMALAFAAYLADMAIAIMQRTASLLLGLPRPSPLWIGLLNATWVGFGFALARGRRPVFSKDDRLEIIVAGILGAVTAVALFFAFGGSFDTLNAGQVVLAILGVALIALLGFVSGALGGLFSHAFTNDGRLENPRWHSDTDFLLPFPGEHYCVQGHRGFISHYRANGDQEFSYDWEFPLGTPILCSKEGHIIFAKEDMDGSIGIWGTGNTIANEIHVRHFDGSTAQYLHLRQDGISEINPGLARSVITSQPRHVYAGQRLAASGNVGISMFPHLHFMVDQPPGSPEPNDVGARRPVKFQDPDTASHDKRCFSMRKYASSNLDRGGVAMTADQPPLNPGGEPTDGSEYPRRVPATGAGGTTLPPVPPSGAPRTAPGGTPSPPGGGSPLPPPSP